MITNQIYTCENVGKKIIHSVCFFFLSLSFLLSKVKWTFRVRERGREREKETNEEKSESWI